MRNTHCSLLSRMSIAVFMTMSVKVNAIPPGYTLAKADEFNGTSLDTSLWIPAYLSCRTTEDRAAARYSFKDSCLVLRIDKDQPTYYPNNAMKVSSIQTGQRDYLHKDEFDHHIPTIMKYTPQYGYFEIRAKLVNQTGYHCAFWTVGRRDQSWQEAEIDIMEQFGNTAYSNFNFFPWDDKNLSQSSGGKTLPFNPSVGFHLYALEWDSKSIKFYVDDVLIKTVNQSLQYPAVFLLSIYENSGWTGSADLSASKYPREFYVDYFRTYAKDTNVTQAYTSKPGVVVDNTPRKMEVFDIRGCRLYLSQNKSTFGVRDIMAQSPPTGLYFIKTAKVEKVINP
ncbi:MAG: glycoside hydrolase family 16 protein [Chitinispirillaceae bacterium]|nr:glycoside hydrolase family 16 protein [Chitinispirillaceae bacterium]